MAAFPKTEKDFVRWFWQGTNGNELINKLNAFSLREYGCDGDFIRREKHSPCIYGFVIHSNCPYSALPVPLQTIHWSQVIARHPGQVQLMNVGFTFKDKGRNTGDRMEQVVEEVKRRCGAWVNIHQVFMLPIKFVDTTNYSIVEKNIREKMGVSVPKYLAERLCLPVPSEWVFTSYTVAMAFKNEIEHLKQCFENNDIQRMLTTELFIDFSYKNFDTSYSNLDYWVQMLLRQPYPYGFGVAM